MRPIWIVAIACSVAATAARADTPVEAAARRDFAAALAIPVEQVEGKVQLVDVKHAPVLLGRYHEKAGSPWTFPAAAVYGPCPQGTCLRRVHLGASTSRVVALQLVDLDAPKTELRDFAGPWRDYTPPLVEPSRPAGWPALVVGCERNVGADGAERVADLVVISLRDPTDPRRILDLEIERRYPNPAQAGPPGPPATAPRGSRVESITFARRGNERTLTVVDRLIESRWNPCLRPTAGEKRYLLEADGYRQISSKPSEICR